MRCYKVTAQLSLETPVIAVRYAATNALARKLREKLMGKFDVHKKDVAIEMTEIPTDKTHLLTFVNDVYRSMDCSETV